MKMIAVLAMALLAFSGCVNSDTSDTPVSPVAPTTNDLDTHGMGRAEEGHDDSATLKVEYAIVDTIGDFEYTDVTVYLQNMDENVDDLTIKMDYDDNWLGLCVPGPFILDSSEIHEPWDHIQATVTYEDLGSPRYGTVKYKLEGDDIEPPFGTGQTQKCPVVTFTFRRAIDGYDECEECEFAPYNFTLFGSCKVRCANGWLVSNLSFTNAIWAPCL